MGMDLSEDSASWRVSSLRFDDFEEFWSGEAVSGAADSGRNTVHHQLENPGVPYVTELSAACVTQKLAGCLLILSQ